MSSGGRRTTLLQLALIPFGIAWVGSAAEARRQQMGQSDAPGRLDEILTGKIAIHIDARFKAAPQRIYQVLTDAAQFQKAIGFSDAVKQMGPSATSAQISHEVGGAFSLFGGYITGFNVEMDPGERLVQVWRAGSWDKGQYSIVSFVLIPEQGGTLLKFDQKGFPQDQAQSLVSGWHLNYFDAMRKYLA